jgi:hypothetical protein
VKVPDHGDLGLFPFLTSSFFGTNLIQMHIQSIACFWWEYTECTLSIRSRLLWSALLSFVISITKGVVSWKFGTG